MPDSLFTVAEIAELLKVDPQTVRDWIEERALHAVRVGSHGARIRQSELDRFLAAGGREASDVKQPPEPPALESPDQFVGALTEILRHANTNDPAELASALREVAAAAEALADTLEPPGP